MLIFFVFLLRLTGRLIEGTVDLFVLALRAIIRLVFGVASRVVAGARATTHQTGQASKVRR